METRPVNVFSQKTPNPRAYKFACSERLVGEACYEVDRRDHPTGVALLDHFFASWPVQRVFLAENFITVVLQKDAEWFEWLRDMRQYIADYLRLQAFDEATLPKQFYLHVPGSAVADWFAQHIHPATAQDGGQIIPEAFDGETLTVRLAGACYDCPHARMTIEQGIVLPLTKQLGKPLKKVSVVG